MESLRAVSWDSTLPETVEIDGYIPLNVVWGVRNPRVDNYCYWHTGDLKRSILEIGMVRDTGLIRTVTLISAGEVEFSALPLVPCTEHRGVPIIDVAELPSEQYFEHSQPLQVILGPDHLVVSWSPNKPVRRFGCGGRVQVGLDHVERMVSVELTGLTDPERLLMAEALGLRGHG